MTQIDEKELEVLKGKAKSYDEIDKLVGRFYDEENPLYTDGGLDDIGECIAIHLGYL